jgi:hypothetical protein
VYRITGCIKQISYREKLTLNEMGRAIKIHGKYGVAILRKYGRRGGHTDKRE